jgi:hypothetical protein
MLLLIKSTFFESRSLVQAIGEIKRHIGDIEFDQIWAFIQFKNIKIKDLSIFVCLYAFWFRTIEHNYQIIFFNISL